MPALRNGSTTQIRSPAVDVDAVRRALLLLGRTSCGCSGRRAQRTRRPFCCVPSDSSTPALSVYSPNRSALTSSRTAAVLSTATGPAAGGRAPGRPSRGDLAAERAASACPASSCGVEPGRRAVSPTKTLLARSVPTSTRTSGAAGGSASGPSSGPCGCGSGFHVASRPVFGSTSRRSVSTVS